MARTNVAVAIRPSAKMIRRLRSKRSAQTPANGERKKVGKKPNNKYSVIMKPDWVSSVIRHKIAYDTSDEPNREIA